VRSQLTKEQLAEHKKKKEENLKKQESGFSNMVDAFKAYDEKVSRIAKTVRSESDIVKKIINWTNQGKPISNRFIARVLEKAGVGERLWATLKKDVTTLYTLFSLCITLTIDGMLKNDNLSEGQIMTLANDLSKFWTTYNCVRYTVKGWPQPLKMAGDIELNPGPDDNVDTGANDEQSRMDTQIIYPIEIERDTSRPLEEIIHNVENSLDKDTIEKAIIDMVKGQLGVSTIMPKEINDYIYSLNGKEPSIWENVISTIGSLLGKTMYMGPGYIGGEHLPISSLEQLAHRLSAPPLTKEDAIYRVHDFENALTMGINGQKESDARMINAINALQDPTLQAQLAARALQTMVRQAHIKDHAQPITKEAGANRTG